MRRGASQMQLMAKPQMRQHLIAPPRGEHACDGDQRPGNSIQ